MKQIFGALCIIGLIALGGCSTAQLQSIQAGTTAYNQSVDNFNDAAAAINTSIAKTSGTLNAYCRQIVGLGQSIEPMLTGGPTNLKVAYDTGLAGFNTSCTNLPSNIQEAIDTLSKDITAMQAARAQAKEG